MRFYTNNSYGLNLMLKKSVSKIFEGENGSLINYYKKCRFDFFKNRKCNRLVSGCDDTDLYFFSK